MNCWSRTGYFIGTPILSSCLTMSDAGTITADYKLRTPLLLTDTIRGNDADQVTIDDNVNIKGTSARNGNHITRGFTYEVSPVAASQHTSAT